MSTLQLRLNFVVNITYIKIFSNSSRLSQAEIFNTRDFVIINNAYYTVQTEFNEITFTLERMEVSELET